MTIHEADIMQEIIIIIMKLVFGVLALASAMCAERYFIRRDPVAEWCVGLFVICYIAGAFLL